MSEENMITGPFGNQIKGLKEKSEARGMNPPPIIPSDLRHVWIETDEQFLDKAAFAAMEGMLASNEWINQSYDCIAKESYNSADALLAEKKKRYS